MGGEIAKYKEKKISIIFQLLEHLYATIIIMHYGVC